MKTLLITLSLVLGITACGYDQSQLDEQNAKKKTTDETGTDGAGMTSDNSGSETTVDVNVSVKVNMKKESNKTRFIIYRPKLVTYYEAVANAPKGFRMLSRYEFVQLYDSGQLDDFADANCFVWTSSKPSNSIEKHIWVFHLEQGIQDTFPSSESFATLYISAENTIVNSTVNDANDADADNTDSNSEENSDDENLNNAD